MRILQLTVHFSPNIGGVETHLLDLVDALIKREWEVVVLSYQALVTNVKWPFYERKTKLEIIRIPWFPGFFYKLVNNPFLEFVYLVPGLFLMAPLILFLKNPEVIHAHGLVAGFIGVFWGKFFKKRVIVSTHSIYNFPKKGIYRNFVKWIFSSADFCLSLSKKAQKEILDLGINSSKVSNFTYWIDLKKFRKIDQAKNKLNWDKKFIVFFVGRLVPEKGIIELLDSAKFWKKGITLVVAGSGPLEFKIRQAEENSSNIIFVGALNQNQLPLYYSASDIQIVPSIHEEGFGRVILESLACGTPVIGADRGAIPQAIDETVGKLITITPNCIKEAVEFFYLNRDRLKRLKVNTRKFAERRYSETNVEKIIKIYRG